MENNMQTNLINNQVNQGELRSIKPNLKKVFLSNITTICGGLSLLIFIILIFHTFVGLELFTDILEIFNITINTTILLFTLIGGILVILVMLIIGNYFSLGNLNYNIHTNKLVISKSMIYLFKDTKEIPYENIIRLSFNNDGLFNTVFESGSIMIELSGMKEKQIELEFIDNIQENVEYMQEVMKNYLARKQAQFTEQSRVDNILNKGL